MSGNQPTMQNTARDNFRFTSVSLWLSVAVTLPCIILHEFGVVDPHRDWTVIPTFVCGLLAAICIFISILKKNRQVVFGLLAGLLDIYVLMLPLVCVAPR